MLSGKIWPAHPHPLPDEILSSWIVRVAAANGVRLQPLCWMLFGNAQSPWNRDIDRNAPPWLLKAFSQHTGINYWDIFHTTLVTYRTRLYPRRQSVGQLRWILPVKHHGMQRTAFGQQFCPECLATDEIPYFRKQWRVALFSYCPEHHVELHDACPACGEPVAIYRGDFGRELRNARPMHVCHVCEHDFRGAERKKAFFPDEGLRQVFDELLMSLGKPANEMCRFNLGFLAVMRQFCRVMASRQNHGRLQAYISERLQLSSPTLPVHRICFEQLRRDVRHHSLLCTLWLMTDLERRLEGAWVTKAVRYNMMTKDMDDVPRRYRSLVQRFANWRLIDAVVSER